MEFSIDIHTYPNGEVVIEDFSKEYNLYIAEDLEVVTSYNLYKYSESNSLNCIVKMSMNTIELVDVLLNDHTQEVDTCTFTVDRDGYYIIEHIILPNMIWWNTASKEYKEFYSTIYVTDGEKVYKEVDGKLEECTIKEILDRNIEGTTIKKCKVDVFSTAQLLNCYINYCKQILENQITSCLQDNPDTYARDFIWMTLNVIDYLIGFKLYMEAERLLAMFLKCGNFCKIPDKIHFTCGCS